MGSNQVQAGRWSNESKQMFAVCDRQDESRGASFIGSVAVQALIVVVILVFGSTVTPKLQRKNRYSSVSYIAPIIPPPVHIVRVAPLPPVPLVAPAQPSVAVASKALLAPPPPPAVVVSKAPSPTPVVQVAKPVLPVFETKVAVPVVAHPVKVQLGGFGVNETVAATANPAGQVVAANGFDTSQGVTAKETRVMVATAGFGGGQGSSSSRSTGKVELAGFGATSATPGTKRQPVAEQPRSTPVAILMKAAPIYTDEARRLRVEGEVLVEVVFAANGSLRVIGVVKGLGHGLDEAALAAASKTRFSPSLRDGQPVDIHATLHIIFALS